jgi:two-component system sensor histidine kinase BarA
MDCSMPGMDGIEVTRRMRAHEQRLSMDRVPVIALTAHVVGTAMIGWQDAGIDEVITKPFQLSQISQALARHLRHKQRAKTRPSPATLRRKADVPQTAPNATPVLDPETFGGLRQLEAKGAAGLLTRVIGLYADRAPAALEAIRDSLESGSSIHIAEAAHALKSMSANLGAARVREACGELENAARADDLSKAIEQTAVIEAALSEALVELAALPERLPSGAHSAAVDAMPAKRPLLRVLK